MAAKKIVIVGGGISGLVTAFLLAREEIPVTVVERKVYPFHRVCGEYISNETLSFLNRLGLFPGFLDPPVISKFQLSSVNGRSAILPLKMGGFGVSRYSFDNFLFQKAKEAGATFQLGHQIEKIVFGNSTFAVSGVGLTLEADLVVGSFGKRSVIDASLGRSFLQKRSPYLAVKYHIRTNHPRDLISLHNFKGGYCGVSRVENEITNLCYLSHRDNLRQSGSIKAMEESILFRNPHLKRIFSESDFLVDKPETINEISFDTKSAVDHHVLMTGDAAGMITPLCGNGMAMAMRSSVILSSLIARFCFDSTYSRVQLENDYQRAWGTSFSTRLWAGRNIQKLFGDEWSSNFAVNLAENARPLTRWLISKTHGKTF